MIRLRVLAMTIVTMGMSGCLEAKTPPPRERSGSQAEPAVVEAAPPRFVPAKPEGDIPAVVVKALGDAEARGRTMLVYVGADWCEPCKRFHAAVEAGELDAELAGVEFLEFDADRDRERLVAAGYGGRLVPRFAVPAGDGKFGGKKIEGGVKGDGAVQQLVGRLRPLLAEAGRG